MYFRFAWRYIKAKKSAQAINIISWVTTAVIAFATCCQVLVLSVFNGFESLVKSLYSSFYTDLKIIPQKGKTFILTNQQLADIRRVPGLVQASANIEETALLQFNDQQTMVRMKGVDRFFEQVSGVPVNTHKGSFSVGDTVSPEMVVGSGIQYAAGILISEAFPPEDIAVILPKKNETGTDPLQGISEGLITASGAFSIQQEFDNSYAITNIGFMRQQMQLAPDEYSAVEIKLQKKADPEKVKAAIQQLLGKGYRVQTMYEQNSSLYQTMKLEKWAIYAILTLILVIAAFNMISALSMLVLEKKDDISILRSMGATKQQVRRIFVTEGVLLGAIGAGTGILLALLVCFLQVKYQLIKLSGGSFLIDYFPVKLVAGDVLLVACTAVAIVLLAAWLPARKASAGMH
ncbi:MAG TPA: ABC transporter permease [Chitinophagaceae bacterium]|nr:ABC transporter permease [Chitinophagaceae bacterium]